MKPSLASIRSQLAPKGLLRAGINLSNTLLVTNVTPEGVPQGLGPDLVTHIAKTLNVPIKLLPYKTPANLTASAKNDEWDICTLGQDPERGKTIDFTEPYVEILATYMVPNDSPLKSIEDVDKSGIRISALKGAAYELWLRRNIQSAELVYADTWDGSIQIYQDQRLDALASIRPKLMTLDDSMGTILDGSYMAVQQAIGVQQNIPEAHEFVQAMVVEAKKSGMIEALIEKHNAKGLSVAP